MPALVLLPYFHTAIAGVNWNSNNGAHSWDYDPRRSNKRSPQNHNNFKTRIHGARNQFCTRKDGTNNHWLPYHNSRWIQHRCRDSFDNYHVRLAMLGPSLQCMTHKHVQDVSDVNVWERLLNDLPASWLCENTEWKCLPICGRHCYPRVRKGGLARLGRPFQVLTLIIFGRACRVSLSLSSSSPQKMGMISYRFGTILMNIRVFEVPPPQEKLRKKFWSHVLFFQFCEKENKITSPFYLTF